jgi:hypothetical protein
VEERALVMDVIKDVRIDSQHGTEEFYFALFAR